MDGIGAAAPKNKTEENTPLFSLKNSKRLVENALAFLKKQGNFGMTQDPIPYQPAFNVLNWIF